MKRIGVGGAPVDVATAEEAAHWMLERLRTPGLRTSEAGVNASFVVMAASDRNYLKALEQFDLLIADGFWLALAGACLHRIRVPHTNTSPLLNELFRQSAPDGLRVFLLGARPDVVERAAVNIVDLHPNAHVVDYFHGYFTPEEEIGIVEKINRSGAEIVLLGLSSPKKELFIRKHWNRLKVPISLGVGGQFDIWAGLASEAPDWVREHGFEWLYRFLQEPRRLYRRYTIVNLQFMGLVLKQAWTMALRRRPQS